MTTGRINQVTVLNAPGPKAGARTEYSRRTVCAPLLGQSSLPSTGLRSAVPAAAHPTRPPARGWPSALSWRSTGRLLDPRSHKLRRSSEGPQDQRHPPRWRLPTNGRKQSRCCRDAADLQVVSSRELAIGNQSTPFASARNNRKRALRDLRLRLSGAARSSEFTRLNRLPIGCILPGRPIDRSVPRLPARNPSRRQKSTPVSRRSRCAP